MNHSVDERVQTERSSHTDSTGTLAEVQGLFTSDGQRSASEEVVIADKHLITSLDDTEGQKSQS